MLALLVVLGVLGVGLHLFNLWQIRHLKRGLAEHVAHLTAVRAVQTELRDRVLAHPVARHPSGIRAR